MSIFIGLIPALAWGIQPISATKMGGKPTNQILGMTTGTFIIALIALFYLKPDISLSVLLLSALSGAMWVVGQVGQFTGYARVGVSLTMPLSTGLQLVGTSIIGVFIFGEWPSTLGKIVGFIALAVVVVGVVLTSIKLGKEKTGIDKTTLLILFFTTFGFLGYNSVAKVVDASGGAIFFPQATGMALVAMAYVLLSGNGAAFKQASSWKNILTGIIFAVAALAYIYSAQQNGIATGFVLAQLSVVISTLCGIFILKEQKSPAELKLTIAGLILIVMGSAATALCNTL